MYDYDGGGVDDDGADYLVSDPGSIPERQHQRLHRRRRDGNHERHDNHDANLVCHRSYARAHSDPRDTPAQEGVSNFLISNPGLVFLSLQKLSQSPVF